MEFVVIFGFSFVFFFLEDKDQVCFGGFTSLFVLLVQTEVLRLGLFSARYNPQFTGGKTKHEYIYNILLNLVLVSFFSRLRRF